MPTNHSGLYGEEAQRRRWTPGIRIAAEYSAENRFAMGIFPLGSPLIGFVRMKIENICVLGGTGFVGRHLAARLAREGYRLRLLTRHRERNKDLLVLPRAEVVETHIHDLNTLTDQLRGFDTVINLVGVLHDSGREGRGFKDAHVLLARTVVQAAKSAGVRRMLHMSALNADAAYGAGAYLRSKGEAENLVHTTGKPDLAVTSFRPSVIFGPGDSFLTLFAGLLRKMPGVFPLACPEARFAPVYVGDLVGAMVRCLQDDRSIDRHYEICGPKVYTLRELVRYTAQVTGKNTRVLGLSDTLSKIQARMLEFTPGKPMSYDNYLSMKVDSVCACNALETLGITPTPMESIVPGYLRGAGRRGRYDVFRRQARRG